MITEFRTGRGVGVNQVDVRKNIPGRGACVGSPSWRNHGESGPERWSNEGSSKRSTPGFSVLPI